jgi:hypothetical protein
MLRYPYSVGADEDDVSAFIASLPPEFHDKPFVHVLGAIHSAPLDLPARANQFRDAIAGAGWTWFERGFDTDVRTLLGVPLPGAHTVEGMMFPTDGHTPVPGEGQAAVDQIMHALELNYSALGEWVHEVNAEVVQPTLREAGDKFKTATTIGLPLVAIGLAALAVIYLAVIVPRPRR